MAGAQYTGPEFDKNAFFGSFWTVDENFEGLERGLSKLKDYFSQGADFTQDAVSIIKERFAQQSIQYAVAKTAPSLLAICFLLLALIAAATGWRSRTSTREACKS